MRNHYFSIKKFAKKNYNTKMTVRDLVIEFCSRPNLHATTQRVRQQTFDRYLGGYYSVKILSFSKKQAYEVAALLDNHVISRKKSPLKQNTKWAIMKNIKTLFNYAEEEGYIPNNPFNGFKYSFVKKAAKYLSPAEMNTLINAEYKNEELKTAVLLALCAGLRRGEVLGLQWGDIDMSNRTLTVRRSYAWFYGKGYIKPTKNRHERVLPINNVLYKHLKEIERIDENVIHLTPSFLTAGLPAFAEKIGIHRYSFHDLRRTFGTTMLQRGVDLKTCSILLGHQDVLVTSDFYVGIVDEMARNAVKEIDKIIEK